jgi:hypothetical protein
VHEAPEIDGIVRLPDDLAVGDLVDVALVASEGPDLRAVPLDALALSRPGARSA